MCQSGVSLRRRPATGRAVCGLGRAFLCLYACLPLQLKWLVRTLPTLYVCKPSHVPRLSDRG